MSADTQTTPYHTIRHQRGGADRDGKVMFPQRSETEGIPNDSYPGSTSLE